MLKRSHISSPFVVNSCASRNLRAWPRYSSIKPTTPGVEPESALPKGPPVLLSPEPLHSTAKKPLPTFRKIDLKYDTRSLSFKFDHLGLQWDPLNGTVSLVEEKRMRCLQAVKKALSSIGQPLQNQAHLRSLLTALLHACHAVVSGRLHLESLIVIEGEECQGEGQGCCPPIDLQERMKQDLKWWASLLEKGEDVTEISILRKGKVGGEIYTDASPWGLAMVIDEKWANQRWKHGLNPNTHWAEATAVEVAVWYLATRPGATGSHFIINCDSTAVVDGWTMGSSSNTQVNRIILPMLRVLVRNNCWLSLEWISSKKNRADIPSRSVTRMQPEHRMKWDLSVMPGDLLAHLRDVDP